MVAETTPTGVLTRALSLQGVHTSMARWRSRGSHAKRYGGTYRVQLKEQGWVWGGGGGTPLVLRYGTKGGGALFRGHVSKKHMHAPHLGPTFSIRILPLK